MELISSTLESIQPLSWYREEESAFHQPPEACHSIIATEDNECDWNEEELLSSRANLHLSEFKTVLPSREPMSYEKRHVGFMSDRSIGLSTFATLESLVRRRRTIIIIIIIIIIGLARSVTMVTYSLISDSCDPWPSSARRNIVISLNADEEKDDDGEKSVIIIL